MPGYQPLLPFGPIHNVSLFSSHWLDHRLSLEPEYSELRDEAASVLDTLAEIWKQQRDRVERYGNEAGLEHGFIQPVLAALGWKLKYQAQLRNRKPDYALFIDDASFDGALRAGHGTDAFWSFPKLLADAKAWGVNLDRRSGAEREYPPEQIEWYLERSHLDFAILTNGRLWRLIPRLLNADQPRFHTYFECEVPTILKRGSRGRRHLSGSATHLTIFCASTFSLPPSRSAPPTPGDR